eukprot:g15070.t1
MIGCARYSGPRLADVLRACGTPMQHGLTGDMGKHRVRVLHFFSSETEEKSGRPKSVSLTYEKALESDTILALDMNGFELPLEQGFPVRLIVPGYCDFKSLKWVSKILVEEGYADELSPMGYLAVKRVTIADEAVRDAGTQALTSLICAPETDDTCYVQEGAEMGAFVEVRGIAYSGNGHGIRRVQLSADNGRHWVAAEVYGTKHPHAWVQWKQKVPLSMEDRKLLERDKKRDVEIMVRATNGENRTQGQSHGALGGSSQGFYPLDRVKLQFVSTSDAQFFGSGMEKMKSKRMSSRKPSKVEKESFKKAEKELEVGVKEKEGEETADQPAADER